MFNNLEKYESNIAIISDKNEIVYYKDLVNFANDIKGIAEKRKLVFQLCSNTVSSIKFYVSFLRNKTVPVLLDRDLDKELLSTLIETYKPFYLCVPKNMKNEFLGTEELYSDGAYCLLKTGFRTEYPLNEELGLMLTTSGSTGSPKFVKQSYKNVESNAESIAQYLGITSSDRPITTLPMNYTYGLSIINSHFIKGATLLLTDKTLMQKEFWDFFKKEKATTFGGVPYTYEMLKKLRFFGMDLPSLKYLTQAGGKLSYDLTKEFVEFCSLKNVKFIVMYGQTEATARMSYLPPEYALSKCGSMGIAIPGGKFSLIDENGAEITESNVVGELVYEGPNVTMGYAQKGEDLAKGDERFGKLITGDMAKRDDDGFYFITGRKKRFIKIFGKRVNLDECERLVKSICLDCACAGVDDKMKIYITDSSLKEKVKNYIAEKTGINFIAFDVIVIDKIPKNESGKVIYAKL